MPSEYKFYSGQYPYPLNNTLSDGGVFLKEFISGDPSLALPDVDNWYVICATPQQMLKIQSSLEVGAPIAYPDFYADVFQLVQQAYEFPNSFDGANCVSICELLIDCIENDSDVQSALSNYFSSNQLAGSGTPNGVSPNIAGLGILDGSLCDPNNIFALATQTTDLMNTIIIDFFETIEATSYLAETIAIGIEAVPGLGELPFDDLIELLDNFVEQAQTGYEAAYNTTVRDTIRCQLFCLVLDNDCILDWSDVAQYFADKASQDFFTLDLQDLFEFLTQGLFAGTEWVYAMHWFLAGMLSLASKFVGIDATGMVKAIAAASNDSDSDWSILCSDCAETWLYLSDFPDSEEGWVPREASAPYDDPQALWVDMVGWTSQDVRTAVNVYGRIDGIRRTFASTYFDHVELTYDLIKGSYDSDAVAVLILVTKADMSTVSAGLDFSECEDGVGQTLNLILNADIVAIDVVVRSSKQGSSSYSGSCQVVSIRASGEGDNPFV